MRKIIEILEEIRPEHDFAESTNYVQDGLLDSFDIIEMIDIIESEYDIKIDGVELVPENFASIDSIKELILKSGGKIAE